MYIGVGRFRILGAGREQGLEYLGGGGKGGKFPAGTCRPKYFILYVTRVAQSVGHLTRKSGVLGSIPGLATYFRFSFRFFK